MKTGEILAKSEYSLTCQHFKIRPNTAVEKLLLSIPAFEGQVNDPFGSRTYS
jgi:hypothetical protein